MNNKKIKMIQIMDMQKKFQIVLQNKLKKKVNFIKRFYFKNLS